MTTPPPVDKVPSTPSGTAPVPTLGTFLRGRRMGLKPEDVGIARAKGRNVSGLRRAEVAELADMSLAYYTFIERGRDLRPSRAVLDSIGRALLLTARERRMLRDLRSGEVRRPLLAQEEIDKALFGAHPYGFTVPSPAAITKATRQALTTFAATYYVPNNAILVVAGDFEAASMRTEVTRTFGSWRRAPLPPAPKLVLPVRAKRQIYVIDRPGSVQSTIIIGAAAPPRRSPDYIPLRTTNMIYGGSFYSRLTRNIREAKGYTYSPYSTVNLRRAAGSFEAGASVRNEVTGPAILEMLYELDRMRVAPVTAEELESAKTYSIGGMELELEAQASLAGRISSIYVDELPRDFLQTFRDKVSSLTTADIQRNAARYFDTYRGAIVVVGDYKAIKDQIAPFGDVTVVK